MNRKQEAGSVRDVMGRIRTDCLVGLAGRTGRWLGQVGAATATLAFVGVFADPGLPRADTPTQFERSVAH